MEILPEHRETSNLGDFKDVSLLLVEDNKMNQKVVIAILTREGCRVDVVENGLEAVEQIKKEKYCAVLMDCQMPVMDGFETARKIREMDEPIRNIPIVAVTAVCADQCRMECFDAGMNDFLAKPVGRQQLIDAVRRHAAKS